MAKVFLFENEAYTAVVQSNTSDEYFGSAGTSDILKLGLNASTVPTGLDINDQIERIEFTGNVADYTFKLEGNELTISANGAALAQVNLGNNPTFAFADGSATMEITGQSVATFGGQAVPTDDTAFATAPTLDAADPSSNADASTVTPPPAGTVDLGVGATATNATGDNATNEVFSFDVEAALATVDNTQVTITGFDVANDKLSLNLADAIGSTTLDQVTAATVQSNPITQSTLVNFGADANGDIVTLTLAGLTDATAVNVEVV